MDDAEALVDMLGDWIKITFVFTAPAEVSPSTVLLAGDFNGWASTSDGRGAVHLVRDADDGEAGASTCGSRWTTTMRLVDGYYRYKYVVDGEYYADPAAGASEAYGFHNSVLRVGHGGVTAASISSGAALAYPIPPVPHAAADAFVVVRPHELPHDALSAAYGFEPRPLYVYLPPQLRGGRGAGDDDGVGLPVLYVLDGQHAFGKQASHGMFLHSALDALWASGEVEPFIAVAIPALALKRKQEYVPRSFLGDGGAGSVESGLEGHDGPTPFLHFLLTVVKPYATALLGASFGGLTALMAALHAPQTFGAVAGLSPSFWFLDSYGVSAATAAAEVFGEEGDGPRTRMYFGVGGKDDELAQLYETRGVVDALIGAGLAIGDEVVLAEHADGAHNESSWAAHLPAAIPFLFPGGKRR
ncbi:1 carbohydrate esterase [Thecamonas trahens ATCC 50062]|uniref:1 carbohydrate esterase n=1 Tax=Thecamonas trahens ATCC 50062 TaxID=461836 RepID=A0A0L0DP22_THETB|nr:1 carbohydrate esterase [Thecamonas trahens ATCC 50062]KNC54015.1 1 carbohydrate esterase [Thecamonas trahens ATCC 50062]|eukprot:XP_013754030.1 1 carbohydrate esterase [Thecamonas trahens ATCC 50062]